MDNFNMQTYIEPEKIKKSFFGPKIIFIILGIIIIVEAIYAVKVLTSPASAPYLPAVNTATPKNPGKISLITPKTNYSMGEEIPVSVMIDTGANTISGVDLIVRFDPQVLTAVSTGIIKGKIFDDYPLVAVDAGNGLVSVSGISNTDKTFKGAGEFAVITMKAKKAGRTAIAIDFKKGTTTSSNLVDAATTNNVLDTVDNLELIVQ